MTTAHTDRKIVLLRPGMPLRSVQLQTKNIIEQQRVIRDLSSKLRELRSMRKARSGGVR
jgi:hypothetical protein